MAAVAQLVRGIRMYLRRVPSEDDVAGGSSRGGAQGADADAARGHLARDLPGSLRAAFARRRDRGGGRGAVHW